MERRHQRRLVRVPGGRHESCAVVCPLALRAALVHCRPRALDACDALGAHGSKPASMYDSRPCEVCDTILLSSQLLRMFSVQTTSVSVFLVVRLSRGII